MKTDQQTSGTAVRELSTDELNAFMARTVALSVPLHESISAFTEQGARYVIADQPGLALFERTADATMSHISNSPDRDWVELLAIARTEHCAQVGVGDDQDNSHLYPLLMICMSLADTETSARLELDRRSRRQIRLFALTEEQATHDPEIPVHDSVLRCWVPLAAADAADGEMHSAILDMHFLEGRTERYAPGFNAPN